jgi:hypothetical protein
MDQPCLLRVFFSMHFKAYCHQSQLRICFCYFDCSSHHSAIQESERVVLSYRKCRCWVVNHSKKKEEFPQGQMHHRHHFSNYLVRPPFGILHRTRRWQKIITCLYSSNTRIFIFCSNVFLIEMAWQPLLVTNSSIGELFCNSKVLYPSFHSSQNR